MDILGYSERGLINSLLYAIRYRENASTLVGRLMRTAHWPARSEMATEQFDHCKLIMIEQSFSDFGDADAVLLFGQERGPSVFLEGKRGSMLAAVAVISVEWIIMTMVDGWSDMDSAAAWSIILFIVSAPAAVACHLYVRRRKAFFTQDGEHIHALVEAQRQASGTRKVIRRLISVSALAAFIVVIIWLYQVRCPDTNPLNPSSGADVGYFEQHYVITELIVGWPLILVSGLTAGLGYSTKKRTINHYNASGRFEGTSRETQWYYDPREALSAEALPRFILFGFIVYVVVRLWLASYFNLGYAFVGMLLDLVVQHL
jgi:hypothetical protein